MLPSYVYGHPQLFCKTFLRFLSKSFAYIVFFHVSISFVWWESTHKGKYVWDVKKKILSSSKSFSDSNSLLRWRCVWKALFSYVNMSFFSIHFKSFFIHFILGSLRRLCSFEEGTPKVFGSFALKMKGSIPSDPFQKTGVCTSSPVYISCTRTRSNSLEELLWRRSAFGELLCEACLASKKHGWLKERFRFAKKRLRWEPVAKVCFESILKNVCEKFVKYVFCRIQLSIPIHLETIVLCKERILGLNALCIDVRKEYVFIFVFIFSMVHMEQNCVMSGFVEKECFLLVRKVVLVLGVCVLWCVCVCMRMDWNPAFSSRKHKPSEPSLPENTTFGAPFFEGASPSECMSITFMNNAQLGEHLCFLPT